MAGGAETGSPSVSDIALTAERWRSSCCASASRVGVTQPAGQQAGGRRFGGQRMGLAAVLELQPVLHPPQESVGVGQRPLLAIGQQPGHRQLLQRPQGPALAQLGPLAGVEQLQQLGDQLHVPDAAVPQLHVEAGARGPARLGGTGGAGPAPRPRPAVPATGGTRTVPPGAGIAAQRQVARPRVGPAAAPAAPRSARRSRSNARPPPASCRSPRCGPRGAAAGRPGTPAAPRRSRPGPGSPSATGARNIRAGSAPRPAPRRSSTGTPDRRRTRSSAPRPPACPSPAPRTLGVPSAERGSP